MLTRQLKGTIPATLTVKGQGEEPITFNITFHNRRGSEVAQKLEETDVPSTLLFLVESWEAEYPLTEEGIREMEDDRPGMLQAIFTAYGEARSVAKVKN
jgi:hypothetical protein